jgi:inner membrane protein
LDPIAHTLTGAALAVSGLKRTTPLATAALLIGANIPDVDALMYFGEDFGSLAFRRGWTHGLLALAIHPFVVTGLLLLWDRYVRLKAHPNSERARASPLLGVAALAVLSHPALDWLNNYGLRWLMPFDGRWFYGDAVFIVDPWIWLAFGGVAFALYSRRTASLSAWCVFWLIGSLLVSVTPGVPLVARVLWFAGVAAAFLARSWVLAAPGREPVVQRAARTALAVVGVYVTTMAVVDLSERSLVRAALADRGIGPIENVMVAPVAANPFAGEVVAETPSAFYFGSWHWLGEPRFVLAAETTPKRTFGDPVFDAAAQTIEAQRFLTWARFPYVTVETDDEGHVVAFLDARYAATGRLFGPIVRLDPNLRVLSNN